MLSIDRLIQRIRHRRLPQSLNMVDVAYRLAAEDAAQYQIDFMRHVSDYTHDLALHHSVARQTMSGHIVEFGVARGRTFRNWCRLFPNRLVTGFDSWQGLPETWTWLFQKGAFAGSRPSCPKNGLLIEGWFQDTLPQWIQQHRSENIALIHMDCDLYSSTKTVLENLHTWIVPGTIIVFDEYMNYPGWRQDEFMAWKEYVCEHKREYEYIGRVTSHQQAAVRVTV